jgi:hypothetical protein
VSLFLSPYRGGTPGHYGNGREEEDVEPRRLLAVPFRDLTAPAEQLYLVEGLVPQAYSSTLYGDGGAGKSFLALSLAIAVAEGAEEWLGRKVRQGPALYLDFELDEGEQRRRADRLARGAGLLKLPDSLYYMSALEVSTGKALDAALEECKRLEIKFLVLDSLGPALEGDAEAANDVLHFFKRRINPFRAQGVTPFVVDHQPKPQHKQRYQDRRPFGSVYKGNLARSVVQAEALDDKREKDTLTVVLRQVKHNFGAHSNPFGAKLTFTETSVTVEPVELHAEDFAGDNAPSTEDLVLHALEDGPAYPQALAAKIGRPLKTVRNVLTNLRKTKVVVPTGKRDGQAEEVALASAATEEVDQEENLPDRLPETQGARPGPSKAQASPQERAASPPEEGQQGVDPHLLEALRKRSASDPFALHGDPHELALDLHHTGDLDRQPLVGEVMKAVSKLEAEGRAASKGGVARPGGLLAG